MVNDIIEELLDLDMEPRPESLWWTRTHKQEDMWTVRVGADRVWDLPFCEVSDVGAESTMCKCLRRWWRDEYINRSKTVPMTAKCKHAHSPCVQHSLEWQHLLDLEWSHP